VALVVAVAWVLVLPTAQTRQPIAFNHSRHVAMSCTVCHDGATRGRRAGIPQSDLCLKCHATAPGKVISEAAWTEIAAGRPIAWVQITRLPDHVMFSHRRHTDPGKLSCVSCHGDMQQRTVPPSRAPVRLVMNTCLSCHQREGASEDCTACHR
jgi:hypothetical protein